MSDEMGGKSVVYTLRKAAAEDCMVNREQLRISFVVEVDDERAGAAGAADGRGSRAVNLRVETSLRVPR